MRKVHRSVNWVHQPSDAGRKATGSRGFILFTDDAMGGKPGVNHIAGQVLTFPIEQEFDIMGRPVKGFLAASAVLQGMGPCFPTGGNGGSKKG